ncbi:MAG: type IX secretion system outer membrane channel protein PorV [Flammeovirgaceae bacterium]|nr:type IX secretion system outer membrane channel protein PorV [Flammeovirgaceae bacterium]
MLKKFSFLLLLSSFFVSTSLFSQIDSKNVGGQVEDSNPIITAVPFLNIGPDSRGSGMGDAGVATSPDANAVFWNPSKLAFVEKDMGASFSVTPWLQKIVGDMNLYYLSGYKRINANSTFAASMRYFDLGSMQFTDINRNIIADFNPREFSFDATYAMKLSQKFGMGVTMRYIYSNLSGNFSNGQSNTDAKPANSLAADISGYYTTDLAIKGYDSKLSFGANISNIGPKITYTSDNNKDFIPTNLRIGTALTTEFDPYNKLTFAFDINKLLVPTPPEYGEDENGNLVVVRGKDSSDKGMLAGMFISFADAPGGAKEEFQELMFGTGLEYWYNDLVALRGGYFHEARTKGNRQYFTVGVGLRYQVFGIDFSYLISKQQNHPLTDTMRFTLSFNMDGKKEEAKL